MYGTLAGALEARHVQFDRDRYTASVEGTIDGSDKAQRALEAHPAGCPAHQSVQGAIAVTWDAEIEEV